MEHQPTQGALLEAIELLVTTHGSGLVFPWKYELRDALDLIKVDAGHCVLDTSDYQLSMSKGRVAVRLAASPPSFRSEFVQDVLVCLSALGVCQPPKTTRPVDLYVGPDPRLSVFEKCGCALLSHGWAVGYRLTSNLALPSAETVAIVTSAESALGQSWAQVEALGYLGVRIPPEVEDEAAVASSVCLVNGWPVGYSVCDEAGWTWLSR